MAPLLALAVFVREKPSVSYIAARFDSMAQQLLDEVGLVVEGAGGGKEARLEERERGWSEGTRLE
jgi:hypothetical protein